LNNLIPKEIRLWIDNAFFGVFSLRSRGAAPLADVLRPFRAKSLFFFSFSFPFSFFPRTLRSPLSALFLLFLLFLFPLSLSAQVGGKIDILHANNLHAEHKNGEDIQRLNGNVAFRQNDVTMHCDSAILYSARNVVNAFGHIDINQNDTLHIFGEKLDYDGNTKYAIMREHVRMTDRDMTLLTERLDYDFAKKEALYTTGGNITDAQNKLTSVIGYYFSQNRNMFFKKNVVLVNPKFVMKCDTLQYNIISHKSFFHGPTTITSDKDFIYCENGWYNTVTNKAKFGKNAYMKSDNELLYGDSLFYDRKTSFGRALYNVKIVDTAEKLVIQGQYAEHYGDTKRTFITNQTFVTKGLKEDSMYMTADSIWAMYDSSGKYRIIKGYYHAKVYNKGFQAVADSMVYSAVDSTLDMRTKPVMWFDTYQATGKRILIHTKNNKITKADIYQDAFLASEEDSVRFSQIKGRNMTGFFADNELYRIDVDGNSESMYYVRDEKKAYIGMNKIVSSDIVIYVKHSKISKINFIKDPDANMIPMKDVNPYEARLPGFSWHGTERPKNKDDIREAPGKSIKVKKGGEEFEE